MVHKLFSWPMQRVPEATAYPNIQSCTTYLRQNSGSSSTPPWLENQSSGWRVAMREPSHWTSPRVVRWAASASGTCRRTRLRRTAATRSGRSRNSARLSCGRCVPGDVKLCEDQVKQQRCAQQLSVRSRTPTEYQQPCERLRCLERRRIGPRVKSRPPKKHAFSIRFAITPIADCDCNELNCNFRACSSTNFTAGKPLLCQQSTFCPILIDTWPLLTTLRRTDAMIVISLQLWMLRFSIPVEVEFL